MLISWELLKHFIDIEPLSLTPEEIAERLTFSGSEVESITYTAGKMRGVVAARIDALEVHPTEKKYFIAHLNTGAGEHVCITSATNMKKGDLVFYAGAGSVLPNGMELGTRDFHGVESFGMMLSAQELGLNTCWVALTHGKSRAVISPGEKEVIIISLGYGKTPGTARKSRAESDVSNITEASPEWFRRGIEAALLAPTAVNQQRFRFELSGDNTVTAKAGLLGTNLKVDLGIVKCHFEAGAGKENFIWG